MVSKFGAPDGLCIRAGAVLKGLVSQSNEVHALTQSKSVDGLPEDRIHRFRAVQLNPHFSIDTLSSTKTVAKVSKEHNLEVLHIQMTNSHSRSGQTSAANNPRQIGIHWIPASAGMTMPILMFFGELLKHQQHS